jgi:hypothetical protein
MPTPPEAPIMRLLRVIPEAEASVSVLPGQVSIMDRDCVCRFIMCGNSYWHFY